MNFQINDIISISLENGEWSIIGGMAGGFGSFFISEKLSFDTRAMIGFLNVRSPESTLTISRLISGITECSKVSSASTLSFAYLIGVGLKFDIGSKLYLLTNLDYLGSNPKFSNIEVTNSDGNQGTFANNQNMGTLKFDIGLAFKL